MNRRILISMTDSPDGNFRNKPLLRYAAEAAAIVASILLAFTIDAWSGKNAKNENWSRKPYRALRSNSSVTSRCWRDINLVMV